MPAVATRKMPITLNKSLSECILEGLMDQIAVVVENETDIVHATDLERPDNTKIMCYSGIVAAAGRGNWNEKGKFEPQTLSIGDRVFFAPHAGYTIKEGGKEYRIMRDDDTFATLDKDLDFEMVRNSYGDLDQ